MQRRCRAAGGWENQSNAHNLSKCVSPRVLAEGNPFVALRLTAKYRCGAQTNNVLTVPWRSRLRVANGGIVWRGYGKHADSLLIKIRHWRSVTVPDAMGLSSFSRDMYFTNASQTRFHQWHNHQFPKAAYA